MHKIRRRICSLLIPATFASSGVARAEYFVPGKGIVRVDHNLLTPEVAHQYRRYAFVFEPSTPVFGGIRIHNLDMFINPKDLKGTRFVRVAYEKRWQGTWVKSVDVPKMQHFDGEDFRRVQSGANTQIEQLNAQLGFTATVPDTPRFDRRSLMGYAWINTVPKAVGDLLARRPTSVRNVEYVIVTQRDVFGRGPGVFNAEVFARHVDWNSAANEPMAFAQQILSGQFYQRDLDPSDLDQIREILSYEHCGRALQ